VPEYTLASIAILVAALAVAAWRGVLGERAAWLGLTAFGAATVVADLVLTGLPIVTYGAGTNSGLAIGPMPLEDLAYGLALYLVAIAAWGRGAGRRAPTRRLPEPSWREGHGAGARGSR
jgi:lycopene cyclase domain-containing protein